MNEKKPLEISLETQGLRLSAREAPWDTTIFGFPVAQVEHFQILDPLIASDDYAEYQAWVTRERIGMVSCRLAHDRLQESMLLEANGFRFVEMVLHPRMEGLKKVSIPEDDLNVLSATDADLPGLCAIAETAFGNERYHVDPRLDPKLGDRRYGRWVGSSLAHETQELLKVVDGGKLIGLFIVEASSRHAIYWHLTAIAPQWQGYGYGRRVWSAMLRYHQAEGYDTVSTTISARNSRVLNLYGKLGFRFMPPEMTFHWISDLG